MFVEVQRFIIIKLLKTYTYKYISLPTCTFKNC